MPDTYSDANTSSSVTDGNVTTTTTTYTRTYIWQNTIPHVIYLTGSGSVETDYIIPLKLHRGVQSGDNTVDDVFLNDKCATDFSDVYFTDTSGTILKHYIHSYGNYEIIPDTAHLGNENIITAAGKIVASHTTTTNGVQESSDNGATWTTLNNTAGQIVYVDPITDLYFANFGYLLKRSDAAHTTWTTVLDMTAVSGYIIPYGFCGDAAGTLYAGRYQVSTAAVIYRSLDAGATWDIIYDATADATKQHIHGIGVDSYTGYMYAGVDGSAFKLIRSTNATNRAVDHADVIWTELLDANPAQMIFGSGWRMFSEETPGYYNGKLISTLLYTTDDATFTSEILTGQSGRLLRQVGSGIYLSVGAQAHTRYPQILRRNNDNTWTTIWTAPYDTGTGNDGPRWADYEGVPTGGESQLLIGPQGNYSRLRLFDGGNHHQALVYVKIPTLSATGGDITIHYGVGGVGSGTIADVYPAGLTQTGLLAHYKLDEGSGTTILDDTANNKDGVLTPGTGSWNATGGRKVGQNSPNMLIAGTSYHFNGDGYIEITGSGADADFQFTKNFSVTVWFRATGHAQEVIIGKGPTSGNHWAIELQANNSPPIFYYSQTNKKGMIANNVADGGWHFVGIAVDNGDNLLYCVDGTQAASFALVAAITATNSPIRIGADSAGLYPFTGDIDDAQIYNVALTTTQMRQIYESRLFAPTEPGIVIP